MDNWNNVKDGLPKENKQVLCYSSNNGGYLFITCLKMYDEEWCRCFKVTHWMPLPEHPKGEQDGLD